MRRTASVRAVALAGACLANGLVLSMVFSAPHVVSAQGVPGQRASGSRPAGGPLGAELFATTCRVCHGEAGIGGVGPALRGAKFTRQYVIKAMTDGRTGTMMPQFTKTFTTEEINQVATYVVTLQSPTGPAPGGLRGDAALGESIFFMPGMAHSCSVCHAFKGRGGHVGPDLAPKVAGRSARDIFQKIIVVPHRASDPAYITMKLTTKVGQVLTGIKAGETGDVVRFYDTSSLPPILRTIPKSDIVESERHHSSVMPNDYAARLTLQQLLNVVAFLKSATDGDGSVTLNDVIN